MVGMVIAGIMLLFIEFYFVNKHGIRMKVTLVGKRILTYAQFVS